MNVARASLEELLEDYRDFLRVRDAVLWDKNSKEALFVRKLGAKADVSYESYRTYLETRPPEVAANIIICLIHQTNYLLDQQLRRLEKDFLEKGGLRNKHGCGTTELHVVRPFAGISPDYIYRYLAQRSIRRAVKENFTGTAGQARVPKSFIEDLEIPLAPITEQQRIVAKLEKLLGQMDACQQRLAKIPALLKRFRQAVLAAACSGRLTADWREENPNVSDTNGSEDSLDGFPTLPETWRWKELEIICANVVDCPHSTPKWAESGRLCARTTNFKPCFLDLSEVRYVSEATFAERIERLGPQPGDILYSREGGILGIACMIPLKVELCLGQRMMLFRTKSDFSAALLMYWLNSPVILRRVQELTGGSASPHLNVRDIKSFPTPVPPLPEQQEIVRREDRLFALADRIEARLSAARRQVDALTPSLLARAFAGKLVPQDPADEPASMLLGRTVKAEK